VGDIDDLIESEHHFENVGMTRGHMVRRAVSLGAFCAFAAIWALFLRPQSLGGPISNIAVSGNSMLPTFHSGDFLIVKKEDSYAVGDIVVYSIPADDVGAGRRVVHRIVGGESSGFEMKGDNNAAIDPWRPTQSQIVGQVWFRVPGLAFILSYLRNPGILAAAIAFLTLATLLSPTSLRRKMWNWVKR